MPRTKEQFEIIRETTKNNILNAALELFASKGYSNTSINDIAKSAGVSKGLAYNYFENKQNILEEVIQIIFVDMENMFLIIEELMDPFEKIQKLIDITFNWMEEKEDLGRLYSSLIMQIDVREIVEHIAGNAVDSVIKEIEKIFRKMKIKNPSAEARLLGALLDGMGLHILFMGKEYPIKKMRKFLKLKYSRESLL